MGATMRNIDPALSGTVSSRFGGSVLSRSLLVATLLGGAISGGLSITPAHAQSDAIKATNAAIQSAIQSELQIIRDQIQSRRLGLTTGGRAIGFSGDPYFRETYFNDAYDAFGALGYAKSSKGASPPPAPANDITFSVWGSVSYDNVHRRGFFNGTDIGSDSRTWTWISGGDWVKTGIFATSDALVIGGLHTYSDTRSTAAANSRTTVHSPGNEAYASYINGGFSTDFAFTAVTSGSTTTSLNPGSTFVDPITGTAVVTPPSFVNTFIDQTSYSYSHNLNYRIDFSNQWWVEPTVGYNYTETYFGTPGFQTSQIWTVQGGTRFGTEFMWGYTKVQPTFTGIAYSQVSVRGGQPVGAAGTAIAPGIVPGLVIGPNGTPAAPTDEGKLWGRGSAKVNFQFTDKVSAAVEGEAYGTHDVIGYAARLSGRISF
jgi:hypothetical protein